MCRLRRSTRRGPVYLGARTGLPASTVWRILKRNGLNRLSWIDRPTRRVIRRYERSAPGELVHLDIKKVGKIPPGGGWRVHGRGSDRAKRANRSKRRPGGYTYLHVAIDDYSGVAYVEAHDNETAATLVGFWRRAQDWFWSNDMAVDENDQPAAPTSARPDRRRSANPAQHQHRRRPARQGAPRRRRRGRAQADGPRPPRRRAAPRPRPRAEPSTLRSRRRRQRHHPDPARRDQRRARRQDPRPHRRHRPLPQRRPPRQLRRHRAA